MRVNIDQDKCCGYKLCKDVCPEVYKIDELGLAYTDIEVVPAELEAKAREGAAACPQLAITITEVDDALSEAIG